MLVVSCNRNAASVTPLEPMTIWLTAGELESSATCKVDCPATSTLCPFVEVQLIAVSDEAPEPEQPLKAVMVLLV